MSLTNEWYEYHLTPRGWVEGSEKLDFGGLQAKPIPDDRVITVRCKEYQSCSFAKTEYSRRTVWRSSDGTRVAELIDKFESCPPQYRHWAEEE